MTIFAPPDLDTVDEFQSRCTTHHQRSLGLVPTTGRPRLRRPAYRRLSVGLSDLCVGTVLTTQLRNAAQRSNHGTPPSLVLLADMHCTSRALPHVACHMPRGPWPMAHVVLCWCWRVGKCPNYSRVLCSRCSASEPAIAAPAGPGPALLPALEPEPPRNPPVVPPSRQVRQPVPAHVALQVERDCCVTCNWPSTTVYHHRNLPSTSKFHRPSPRSPTGHRPPSGRQAGRFCPLASALTACLHAPAGPTSPG